MESADGVVPRHRLQGHGLESGGHDGGIQAGGAVADKSNEIPAEQTLLERLDLDGTIAQMDFPHVAPCKARR